MSASEKGLVEITPESWAYSIGSHIAELAREGREHRFGADLSRYKNKFFTFGYQDLGIFKDAGNSIFISFGLLLDTEWFLVDAYIVYDHKIAPAYDALEVLDSSEDYAIQMHRVAPFD